MNRRCQCCSPFLGFIEQVVSERNVNLAVVLAPDSGCYLISLSKREKTVKSAMETFALYLPIFTTIK